MSLNLSMWPVSKYSCQDHWWSHHFSGNLTIDLCRALFLNQVVHGLIARGPWILRTAQNMQGVQTQKRLRTTGLVGIEWNVSFATQKSQQGFLLCSYHISPRFLHTDTVSLQPHSHSCSPTSSGKTRNQKRVLNSPKFQSIWFSLSEVAFFSIQS